MAPLLTSAKTHLHVVRMTKKLVKEVEEVLEKQSNCQISLGSTQSFLEATVEQQMESQQVAEARQEVADGPDLDTVFEPEEILQSIISAVSSLLLSISEC